jgi:hypothetical protein
MIEKEKEFHFNFINKHRDDYQCMKNNDIETNTKNNFIKFISSKNQVLNAIKQIELQKSIRLMNKFYNLFAILPRVISMLSFL